MKKIIVPFLLSLILLANCKDEDSNEALYGVWIGQKISVTDCSDPTSNSETSLRCDDTNCYRLELSSDGTFSFQQGALRESGNWTRGEQLSLCQEDDEGFICDDFTISENTSSTLVIASIHQATACKTSISFQREESLNPDDQQ